MEQIKERLLEELEEFGKKDKLTVCDLKIIGEILDCIKDIKMISSGETVM